MNKEQAKKEYEKIIHEGNEKNMAIIEDAKKKGIWKQGLDSNKELFIENDNETKRKIELLMKMIDS